MKKSFLLIASFCTAYLVFSQQDLAEYSISGSVKAWFPSPPQLLDTLGQQYAYVREGDEMMMVNVAPVPQEALLSDTFSAGRAVERFVNDIVSGSTRLIDSEVQYKGIDARYYKVRMDKETDPLFGLVVDGYCFFLNDTIYNISYWRFRPGELFDYSRQRMFYDKLEIIKVEKPSAPETDTLSKATIKDAKSPISGRKLPVLILGSIVVILTAVILYQRFQLSGNKRK